MSKTDEKFLKAFGAQVLKIRTQQDLSRRQLAFEVGTDEKHIRLIEKGEINTGILLAHKIATALNIKLSKLFDVEC